MALIRRRLSARTDTALVFVTPGGSYRTSMPGVHGRKSRERRASLRRALVRGYAHAYRVRLAERALSFTVQVPCSDARVAAELQLVVRVTDPGLVVEQRVIDPEPYVREHIEAQLRDMLIEHSADTMPEAQRRVGYVLARAEPFRLPEYGLSYGPGRVRLIVRSESTASAWAVEAVASRRPHTDQALTPGAEHTEQTALAGGDGVESAAPPDHGSAPGSPGSAPSAFARVRREDYEFYKELLEEGPLAVLAFWLSQHPESLKEVVEWMSRTYQAPTRPAAERGEGNGVDGDATEGPSEALGEERTLDLPRRSESTDPTDLGAMMAVLPRDEPGARELREAMARGSQRSRS